MTANSGAGAMTPVRYQARGQATSVPTVPGAPVGDVDRRVRQAAQPLAELDARLGLVQPPRGLSYVRAPQAERGATQLARNPDVVAGLGAAAVERDAGRHFAERDDADGALGRARGIAADQLDAVALRERKETGGECFEPRRVRGGQAERQQRVARRGAHGGEVGKVDGERLVAERARCRIGEKVPAFDQHVGSDRQLEPGVRPQQRAVVADAEQRPVRRAVEIAPDELEFVQAMFRARATSSGRSATATFSSTPLTKRWPSVPPKLLPSSTASLSTTLNGVCGCATSSKAPM